MKKNNLITISIFIGIVNWMPVLLIIMDSYFFKTYLIPNGLANLLGQYLKFSFIAPIVSIILTLKTTKRHKNTSYIINIVYLILYLLSYLFVHYGPV